MPKRKRHVKKRIAVVPGDIPANPYLRISVLEGDTPVTKTASPPATPAVKQKGNKKALAIAGGVVGGVAAVAGAVYYSKNRPTNTIKNRPTNTISWHENHPDVHTSALNDAILGTRDWNY